MNDNNVKRDSPKNTVSKHEPHSYILKLLQLLSTLVLFYPPLMMVLFGLLFPMDGSRVIESLGSLWFLTNIFSSKNKSLDSTSDGIATQERINNESSKEGSSERISHLHTLFLGICTNFQICHCLEANIDRKAIHTRKLR